MDVREQIAKICGSNIGKRPWNEDADAILAIPDIKRGLELARMADESLLSFGDLVVDLAAERVTVAGREAFLTDTEYRVLSYLVQNAGRVVRVKELLVHVWGKEYAEETEYVRVFVARLRRKLGDDADRPKYILTRRGVGYMAIE